MRRLILFLSLLAVLVVLAIPAEAQHRHRSHFGKFLCDAGTVTVATPITVYDPATDKWCPSATLPSSDVRGAAGAAGTSILSTAELTVVDGDELGCLHFQAPLESSGSDAILVAAGICAESSTTFSATANTTDLVFKNGVSEAAAETVRILANGLVVPKSVTAPFTSPRLLYRAVGVSGVLALSVRTPIEIEGGTDLWWTAIVGSSTAAVSIDWEGLLLS